MKIVAFILSGMTASLAGMMLAARSTAGNPSLGAGLELDVIAAVIIGGTSLFGGYGSIVGSVIGAIFIGILGFGLLVLGLSTSIQEVSRASSSSSPSRSTGDEAYPLTRAARGGYDGSRARGGKPAGYDR